MLFHRIVPSLLIQTGAVRSGEKKPCDMTAQYRQQVQAEEALERRSYELNPRIRFNHRGQMAMALEVDSVANVKEMQPQFFITTEAAPYLDRKHVVFGTLGAGSPTMFNAIRICGVAVDGETNQPVELEHAPCILSTKIVESEIHTDLKPQASVPWRVSTTGDSKAKKKKKRKGKFDTNVLSFGDEVEDFTPVAKRTKEQTKQDRNKARVDESNGKDETPLMEREQSYEDPSVGITAPEIRPESPKVQAQVQRVEDDSNEEPQPSAIELRRARFAKKKKTKEERENETLEKLMKFRGKLKENVLGVTANPKVSHADNALAARMARRAQSDQIPILRKDDVESYKGQVLHNDNEDEDGTTDWLKTRFKCRRHMDHAAQEKDNDDYQVLDDRKHEKQRRKENDRS